MEDCLFCKIERGEIPSEKVYEDDNFIVIKDINPAYVHHLLIIPRKHIASINDVAEEDDQIFASIFRVAKKVAGILGVEESGYRVLVNTGKDAGQIVFHFHMHFLAGEKLREL